MSAQRLSVHVCKSLNHTNLRRKGCYHHSFLCTHLPPNSPPPPPPLLNPHTLLLDYLSRPLSPLPLFLLYLFAFIYSEIIACHFRVTKETTVRMK